MLPEFYANATLA